MIHLKPVFKKYSVLIQTHTTQTLKTMHVFLIETTGLKIICVHNKLSIRFEIALKPNKK